MAYRPSHAGFDLNAGSALAGVAPASLQAAVIGSTLSLIGLLATGLVAEGMSFDVLSFWEIPGIVFAVLVVIVFAGLVMMAIGTVLCAMLVALIGVPVAMLLGHRLGSPFGLAMAAGLALLTGAALGSGFWFAPIFEEDGWLLALLILTYALPSGLFYRREVLTARQLSPFADPTA
jgi:hypothetical protein